MVGIDGYRLSMSATKNVLSFGNFVLCILSSISVELCMYVGMNLR